MLSSNLELPTLAIIGGTGALGQGIALRAAVAGYRIIIGSRTLEKAQIAAKTIASETNSKFISGESIGNATKAADMIIISVPYSAHADTIGQIKAHVSGKIVVDTTVPLNPPKIMRVQIPAEGTAAKQTQRLLGGMANVVAAFHSVAAAKLSQLDKDVDCDILVFGDKLEAREAVAKLIVNMGLKPWHAGSLDNAIIGEALTSTLIFINKKYKIAGAGIRITGQPQP